MIDRLRKKPTETHLQAKKRVFREGLVTRFPSIDAAIAAIKSKRPKNKIREKMIETVREGEVEIYEIKGSNEFYVNFSVPEEFHEECLSSRWESWAALKISAASEENSGSINEGYLIRIYMDTPVPPEEPVKERSNLGDTVVLINLILIVVLIVYLIFRKK